MVYPRAVKEGAGILGDGEEARCARRWERDMVKRGERGSSFVWRAGRRKCLMESIETDGGWCLEDGCVRRLGSEATAGEDEGMGPGREGVRDLYPWGQKGE